MMELRLAEREVRHPAVAPADARVCLVECFESCFARVFGPYPRSVAMQKREAWNRAAPKHWRYEFWEDFDATLERHALTEPGYTEANRRETMADYIAHWSGPVYVVRTDKEDRIIETFFGPVPRRVGNHAMCEKISVINWLSMTAASTIFEQPPSVLPGAGRVWVVWRLHWEKGRIAGPGQLDMPYAEDWPTWPGIEDEPELLRNSKYRFAPPDPSVVRAWTG